MAKYTTIVHESNIFYTETCPAIIAASALLKDNTTNIIVLQVKIRNINPQAIKALTLSITAKDSFNQPIGNPTIVKFSDTNISRNEDFGQNSATVLPDKNTRNYEVRIAEILLADGQVWTDNADNKWESTGSLHELFATEPEMLKQYRLEINPKAVYNLSVYKDIWFCACGAINKVNEESCHSCSASFNKMQGLDFDVLSEHCNQRLEKEKAEKEEAARKAAEEARIKKLEEQRKAEEQRILSEKREKTLKKAVKITSILAVCVIAIVLLMTFIIIPNHKYNSAMKLMDTGEYERAYAIIENLKHKEVPSDVLQECESGVKYNTAKKHMESENYFEALREFNDLGDFKDSKALFSECIPKAYESAIAEILSTQPKETKDKDLDSIKDGLALIKDYSYVDPYIMIIDGMQLYKNGNYADAYNTFAQLPDDIKNNNMEWYENWIFNIISKHIETSPHLSLEEVLDWHSKLPASHSDYKSEFFNNAQELQNIGPKTYMINGIRHDKEVTITEYFAEKGKLKASFNYHYQNSDYSYDNEGDIQQSSTGQLFVLVGYDDLYLN